MHLPWGHSVKVSYTVASVAERWPFNSALFKLNGFEGSIKLLTIFLIEGGDD